MQAKYDVSTSSDLHVMAKIKVFATDKQTGQKLDVGHKTNNNESSNTS